MKGSVSRLRPTFLTFILAVSTPALAKVDPDSYRAKVEDGLRESAKAAAESFFAQAGLEPPEAIDVTVETVIDFAQKEPVLEEATVAVTMTTEHQPPVVREARAQVARSLAAQGFRFSADVDDQRPLATLKVGVVAPAHLEAEGREFKEYFTLAAIFVGFLATLSFTFYLVIRPFRRKKARIQARRLPQQPSVELPPLPGVEDPALDVPLPSGVVDFKELAKASAAVVRRTFDQLPFDQAFAMLAAADPLTRTQVIDKLQLQPAVRERLERELSQPQT